MWKNTWWEESSPWTSRGWIPIDGSPALTFSPVAAHEVTLNDEP
jgi:hypothetical protein